MAQPQETVWDRDPHTGAKHEMLRRYLAAWFPILLQGGFSGVTYAEGFAGPGEYKAGEELSVASFGAGLTPHDQFQIAESGARWR